MKVAIKRGVGCVLLTLLLFLSAVVPALADIPEIPHSFYGTLTCGGTPPPAGVTVKAKVDGVECGSLVTTASGQFGGPNLLDPKLAVQGLSLGGHTIEFYISNAAGEVKADQTYIFQSGAVTQLNMTSAALPAVSGGGVVPPAVLPTPPQLEAGTGSEGAALLSGLSSEVIASLLGQVSDAKVADILSNLPTGTAGAILANLTPEKAASVMQTMSTDQLLLMIQNMTCESLLHILPLLTADKLHQIPEGTLFALLPCAPTNQLVKEIPPEPPPSLDKPVVYELPNGAKYVAVKSIEGKWVILAATPKPIGMLKIKTGSSLSNIETTIEMLQSPPEAAKLSTGVKAFSFFNITLGNIKPADILSGHISFYVEKKWISDNNINQWAIFLSRYDPDIGRWVRMPTVKKEETTEYVYYNAALPAFSLFAIIGSQTVNLEEFTASNMTIVPNTIKAGEKVNVSADIINDRGVIDKFCASVWFGYTVEGAKYLTLSQGQSTRVSFDVTVDEPGTYMVRIGRQLGNLVVTPAVPVIKPAKFEVSQLTVTPGSVGPGQEVTISATVSNTGEAEGSYEAVLNINGVKETAKSVTLAGGKSTAVTFKVSRTAAGTYQVELGGQRSQFVVVVPPGPAKFEVSQLSIAPATVKAGETVTISAKVTNTGGAAGTYDVVLKVNGAQEATGTVTLAVGQSTTVTFTVTKTQAATYQVEVDGQRGQFTVEKLPRGIPWWVWLIIGLVVVGIVVYFVRRRMGY